MTPTNGREPKWPKDKLVRVQFRNGERAVGPVGKWQWGHGRPGFPPNWDFDVVAVEAVK